MATQAHRSGAQVEQKRILRVMKKFGIKPYRRRVRRPAKPNDLGKPPVSVPNVTKNTVSHCTICGIRE